MKQGIVFVFMCCFGCASTPRVQQKTVGAIEDGQTAHQMKEALSRYWPLHIGHQWTYELDGHGQASPATRVVEIVAEDKGFFVDASGGRLQVRPDGIFDGHRFLIQTPLQKGHRWKSVVGLHATEIYEIVDTHATVVTPAGQFEDCLHIRGTQKQEGRAPGQVVELEMNWYYAKDVGLIKMRSQAHIKDQALPGLSQTLLRYNLKDAS